MANLSTSNNKLTNSGELAFRMISPHRRGTKSKKMVEEAKKAHGDLGTDTAENHKFIVVGHGPRWKVIKIKKTTSSARM